MNSLKEKLRKRDLTIGSWITLGHSSVAELMAGRGFDWLVVDMEHSVITLEQAQQLIQVISLKGVSPLVRVGKNDACIIKRVMDAGACGVIVPMVNCRQDALRAVSSVKYPPEGSRGVGLARAQGYGLGFKEYKNWLSKNSIVIAQIEHIDAIKNLDEILEVEGLDATIIGPYDLSGSLGRPGEFNHPQVKRAIREYEEISRKHKKPTGFHVVQPDAKLALEFIKKGYSFLAVGIDTLYLGQKCNEVLGKLGKRK